MQTMYPAIANSPVTALTNAVTAADTTIQVTDGSVLLEAPNVATIGVGPTAETILYTGKSGNILSGVTRGFQGAAQAWAQGTQIGRYFTAYDHEAFRKNIEELFTSVSNGKNQVATAITGKGVPATGSDTFLQLTTKIMAILVAQGNAQPSDVRAGKTFSNTTGNNSVGTLVDRGNGGTVTPGTADITKSAGIYNTDIIIKGDANLTAANILQGKSIFGVAGTLQPGNYKIGDLIQQTSLTKVYDDGINKLWEVATGITGYQSWFSFAYGDFVYVCDGNYLRKFDTNGTLIFTKLITDGPGWEYKIQKYRVTNEKLQYLAGNNINGETAFWEYDLKTDTLSKKYNRIGYTGLSTFSLYDFVVLPDSIYHLARLLSTGNWYLTKWDCATQTQIWSVNLGSSYTYKYLFSLGGTPYVVSDTGVIWRVNTSNGALTSVSTTGLPVYNDDTCVYLATAGKIIKYDASFNQISSFDMVLYGAYLGNMKFNFKLPLTIFGGYYKDNSNTYHITYNKNPDPGSFDLPYALSGNGDMAIDTKGDMYFADYTTYKLAKYTAQKLTWRITT